MLDERQERHVERLGELELASASLDRHLRASTRVRSNREAPEWLQVMAIPCSPGLW